MNRVEQHVEQFKQKRDGWVEILRRGPGEAASLEFHSFPWVLYFPVG